MEIQQPLFISKISTTPNSPRKYSFATTAYNTAHSQQPCSPALEQNYEALVFRDTFTRQKYRLGALKQDSCWLSESPSNFLANIVSNRNKEIMKAKMSMSRKSSNQNSQVKLAPKRTSGKRPAVKKRCMSSHIVDQQNLRKHLYEKKPLSALIPKKHSQHPVPLVRRGFGRNNKYKSKQQPIESIQNKCDKLCRQIQVEVKNKLAHQCRYLIEPESSAYKSVGSFFVKADKQPKIRQMSDFFNVAQQVGVKGSYSAIKQDIFEMERHLTDLDCLRERQLKALQSHHVSKKAQKFIDAVNNSDNLQIQFSLKDCPELINAQDKKGNTGLHLAARNGDLPMIQLLLRKGANPGIRNKFGKLSLDIARHFDQKQVETILKEFFNFMDTKQSLMCTLIANS